ncbi:MAG: hypothetical protein ACLQU3_09285 [Limisphaerales bacterium]
MAHADELTTVTAGLRPSTAAQRGEVIPAVFLNRIGLKFLFVHEKMPACFFDEHLQYEVDKYIAEGLRPDYKQELPLSYLSPSSDHANFWCEASNNDVPNSAPGFLGGGALHSTP